MSGYFPQEVVLGILHLLPADSLVRFTLVCKSWYSTITSRAFISAHLQCSLSNPNPLLLIRHYSETLMKENYSLFTNADSFTRVARIECPFAAASDLYFRVVGTINGLVCLSNDLFGCCCHSQEIIIWNPLIHKYVKLPAPLFHFNIVPGKNYFFIMGFGFDLKNDDYKVIRVVYPRKTDGNVPPKVEIYSLKKKAWRAINASYVDLRVVDNFWTQCFLHGNVHWVAYDPKQNAPIQNWIMLFNVEEEKFKKMKLPENLAGILFSFTLFISVIRGVLSVLKGYPCRDSVGLGYDIWMKREYADGRSWSKVYTVDIVGGVGKTLGLRKNGDILVTPYRRIVSLHSFNPKSKEVRDLRIQGTITAFYCGAYTGSLVLLDKESGSISCPVHKSYVKWKRDDDSAGLELDETDSIEEKENELVGKYLLWQPLEEVPCCYTQSST